MKTQFCFSNFEDPPVFFQLDGDYSHLDNVFTNDLSGDRLKEDELSELLWNEDGSWKVERFVIPTKEWDYFVRVGVLP